MLDIIDRLADRKPYCPTGRPPRLLFWVVGGIALILFICSSIRHALFQSTAFDLAIYDQVAYLMSRGLTPYSTISDMHHMGNHAAYSFFVMGIPYRLYPSVHWLFAVQAIGLAAGMLPSWALANQAGLRPAQCWAIAWLYVLYPLIFNLNLFDFHPEVMGIAALLGAIWAARANRWWWFTAAILWVLGCKAVLSLTVTGMGLWLFVFERKRRCGAIALALGTAWFVLSTQVVIPAFNYGQGHDAIGRYAYLGDSIGSVLKNLILRPDLVFGHLLSWSSLEYLLLLFVPVIWWLLPGSIAPLVSAIPALSLNLLSTVSEQRDLVHQYSLPILPFLIVAAIANLRQGYPWLKIWVNNGRAIVIWSAICFIALAKFGYFGSIYLDSLDTWKANREAIAQIDTPGGVLTTADLAPHLSHRSTIRQTVATGPPPNWEGYQFVLLNLRHPGWGSTREYAAKLRNQLNESDRFKLTYDRDGVMLFQQP